MSGPIGNTWYSLRGQDTAGRWLIDAVLSDHFSDGSRQHRPVPDGATVIWTTSATADGMLHLQVIADSRPETPVWFVIADEPVARHPACNVVAFTGDHVPDGTIVDQRTFARLRVANAHQVGAIRWYRTGLIHQIFVRKDFRRNHLGTMLLYACSSWQQANAWPGKVYGDGRRTIVGEKFVANVRHPNRHDELVEVLPDMDPPAPPAG